MKRVKHKLALIGLSILSISSLTVVTSCSNDDITITDPRRFTAQDVQSYADLFDVFWKTMDQQYNYFYEQKNQGGVDWDEVHKTYYPKFAALKTYGRINEDDGQINEHYLAAFEYFKEIVDPIIDRHFYVQIQFPATNKNISRTETLYGGMLSEDNPNTYPYVQKFNYMARRVTPNSYLATVSSFGIIAGNLTSNPEIFYLTFNQYALSGYFNLTLPEKYLNPGEKNAILLSKETLANEPSLLAIQDAELREQIKAKTYEILDQYNSFNTTEAFLNYVEHADKFRQTDVVSDEFVKATQDAMAAHRALPKYETATPYGSLFNAQTQEYVVKFIGLMNDHVKYGYRFSELTDAFSHVINKAPFYQKFLNPLHKGEIKKMIIDLRSNGGGAVMDARFLLDRFITEQSVFAYQRTREGNGRFNYTPWVPATARPHAFAMPANIPIAILTDRGSASMSEITTLMLKSQGDQVVSIGDYSAGATAGLGPGDDFNGGTTDNIAGGKLRFYMPLLAMKDAQGVVVEGVGIKPNILVDPLTDEELLQMTDPNFDDRVINEAIKYLSTK